MMRGLSICMLGVMVSCWLGPVAAGSAALYAQDATSKDAPATNGAAKNAATELYVPNDVEVKPVDDRQIESRLQRILEATSWYRAPHVRVQQGIVFLSGDTDTDEYRIWATDLAKKTQDVVAVVNQMKVLERSMWDLGPAWSEVKRLSRETVQSLPLIGIAIICLALAWLAFRWTTSLAHHTLDRRLKNRLLANVVSRAVGILVFLLGLYLALRVSGLTQIAATVLGGTGLIGLVLGIAFRDIAENFLASILISMQRPFALGDLIEVEGHRGIVQSVTTRGTLLMTVDGNHVQIPNASVYKSVIRNITANPNVRCEFLFGIAYDNPVATAQDIILRLLKTHDAVLHDPEPQVLIEDLTATAVNLRVYFWINAHVHSIAKARSSVLRLAKAALEDAEIAFPASAAQKKTAQTSTDKDVDGAPPSSPAEVVNKITEKKNVQSGSPAAGDDLKSDQQALEQQARQARKPEQGENLLSN